MRITMTAAAPESRPQRKRRIAAFLVAISATLLPASAALATKCGPNQISATIQVPKASTPNVLINKQVCESCGLGKAPNAAKTECVPSAAGCPSKHLNPVVNVCEPKCGPGQGINDFKNTCQSCNFNTVSHQTNSDQHCVECASDKVPNASHTKCVSCPPGQVPAPGAGVPVNTTCVPANKKKAARRPLVSPGLLEGTPGLGSQGPAATGRPLGGGATSRGPAGVR